MARGPQGAFLGCLLLLAAPMVAGCIAPGDAPSDASSAFALDCAISNWGDPCTVLASPNDSPSKTEIDIAVNPRDPANVFVASRDLDPLASDCAWSVGQVTKDGGRTWTTVYVGGTLEERRDPLHPLHGYRCVTDPALAWDLEGVLYYVLQVEAWSPTGTDQPGPDLPRQPMFLAVSRDGGATFAREDIVELHGPANEAVLRDYNRMAVSLRTGTVFVAWTSLPAWEWRALPPPLRGAAEESDVQVPTVVAIRAAGRIIGDPVYLLPPGHEGRAAFGSGFAAGSDGTLYLTLHIPNADTPGRDYYLAVSRDDGENWEGYTSVAIIDPLGPLPNVAFRAPTLMELAADTSGGPRDGRLYAVASGRAGEADAADVFLTWSDDGGASWSPVSRVNQDTTATAQWMPRIAVGPDGTLHVLYMDRRWDPADKLYDLTWARTSDGGATWVERRLTAVSSDGDLGIHQSGAPFIGDYNGIATDAHGVWFGFPSTLRGRAEVAVAHAIRAS